jgi:hypothetical protein
MPSFESTSTVVACSAGLRRHPAGGVGAVSSRVPTKAMRGSSCGELEEGRDKWREHHAAHEHCAGTSESAGRQSVGLHRLINP